MEYLVFCLRFRNVGLHANVLTIDNRSLRLDCRSAHELEGQLGCLVLNGLAVTMKRSH